MIYLNFEDDRLHNLAIADLGLILESYYELYPALRNQKTYWFFDEIQNKVVKRKVLAAKKPENKVHQLGR